jgi:hypothetical protein
VIHKNIKTDETSRVNRDKQKRIKLTARVKPKDLTNPGLVQQVQNKNRKHAEFYAPIGFLCFFRFLLWIIWAYCSSLHFLFG